MKKKLFYIGSILVLLLYFVLFPFPLGRELYFIPGGKKNAEQINTARAHGPFYGVEFADYTGFVDPDLRFTVLMKIKHYTALSDCFMIPFDPADPAKEIMDPAGEKTGSFSGNGFPVVIQSRIFVYDAAQNMLEERDKSGNRLWRISTPSLITAMSATESLVLIGYVDGHCVLLDKNGSELVNYRPGGSRIEAVYGVRLSHSGNMFAVISGLDPQRFIVLEKRETDYRPLDHTELKTNYRRPVNIYFSEDDSRIYWEGNYQVNIYNVEERFFQQYNLDGQPVFIDQDGEEGKITLLMTNDKKRYQLELRNDKDRVLFRDLYYADFAGIYVRDELYYIVMDNDILLLKKREG